MVRERILARDSFVRAVFSGQQKGSSLPWIKVVVRPVEIKDEINLQVSWFDEKKDITKNYSFDEAAFQIDELLALPFRNIFVENSMGNLQVNISKKGKALVSEPRSTATPVADLSHDRQKSRLLSAENVEPFLKAVGIMTNDGRIRADMQVSNRSTNSCALWMRPIPSKPGAENRYTSWILAVAMPISPLRSTFICMTS
jgi:hypothetical protein